jgi:hypothetical protein
MRAGAGLDILGSDMLSSGNLVPWDIEAGGRSRELVALLHRRGRDAEHWAVRIDRAAGRITHVSAGPVLRIFDFKPDVRGPLFAQVPDLTLPLHMIYQGAALLCVQVD